MTKPTCLCFIILSLVALALDQPTYATTISAPQDKPLFTLDLPSGWEDASSTFSQYPVALMRDGQLFYITTAAALGAPVEVTAENAKTAVCELGKANGAASCKDTKEIEVAGHAGYSVETSGQYPQEIALFTPDGKTWFVGVAGQNNIGKIEPVLKAIKSKGEGEEE